MTPDDILERRLSHDDNYIKELGSVTKLQDMMAETGEIIPYVNRGDREPGQDGHIFVLGKDSPYSIGRFIVQVKSISVDPEGEGEISIYLKEKHLRYYESEDSPFLYIVVDRDEEIAFWKYTAPGWIDLQDIVKGKSIKFDRTNEISYEDDSYVDEFRDILRKHRSIYAGERVKETKEFIQELMDMEDYTRAIHHLRLELDDASRSVCRARNIPFPHFSKLRGVLKTRGMLDSDDRENTEKDSVSMSQEQYHSKTYRGIVDIDEDLSEMENSQKLKPLIEDGMELLEHLYYQQMHPDFYL